MSAMSHERSRAAREARVWEVLGGVRDPEIPVLSIVDLGVVRYVRWTDSDGLCVGITPTYSGCPATEVIRESVKHALLQAGFADAVIESVLFPPWTSDWLSERGRAKLASFGIAPPVGSAASSRELSGSPRVACPRCGSEAVELVSEFASTACKAHYRCRDCLEPFDYFKCI